MIAITALPHRPIPSRNFIKSKHLHINLPAALEKDMNRDQIKQVLQDYYSAFNKMDEEKILAVFDPNCDFIDLTMGRNMKGTEELSAFIAETWRLSPYFNIEPQEILIDGESAAVRLIMSGSAKVDKNGQPHSGNIWKIPSTSFIKFRNGVIYWKADCWNMLSIPKQIGWRKSIINIIRSNR